MGDHIFKGMGMGFNKKSCVSAIMGMVRHQPLMGDGEGDNGLICRLHAQCIISNNNSGSVRPFICCYLLQNNV